MNVLDSAKEKMRGLTDKASDKANDLSGPAGEKLNSAKGAVAQGLDGAGKFVDEKTGGKYASKINSGVGKAKGILGKKDDRGDSGKAGSDQPGSGKNGPDQPSS